MSTLQTANITDGTNSVETVYVARGSAKSWANLNGTGTIALRDSLNVSSVTDDATGAYTFSFTAAFAAADYAGLFSSNNVSGTGNTVPCSGPSVGYLAGSLQSVVTILAGATVDVAILRMSAHGDLA